MSTVIGPHPVAHVRTRSGGYVRRGRGRWEAPGCLIAGWGELPLTGRARVATIFASSPPGTPEGEVVAVAPTTATTSPVPSRWLRASRVLTELICSVCAMTIWDVKPTDGVWVPVLLQCSLLVVLERRDGTVRRVGLESKPDDLKALLKDEPENTLIVIDDFEIMGGDYALGPVIEEHLRTCRDANGGVLVGCGIDEVAGMYRGVVAQVRKTRTGLILAPRSSEDGTYLSARLPRSTGGAVPKGRGVMVTTGGWSWVQVPKVD